MILDDQRQHMLNHPCRQFDMTAGSLGIGIVNDIGHPLFDSQVEHLEVFLIYAVFAAYGKEEAPHTAHLTHLVLHDDAPRCCRIVLPRGAMTQEEQCQVIALYCSVGKYIDVLFQIVYHLDGRSLTVLLQVVQQTVLAKELPAAVGRDVHGFCKPVRIKQKCRVLRERHLLLLIMIVVFDADGQIGINVQQSALTIGSHQGRGIMGSITIGQMVGTQVEHTDKDSHEDHRVVGRSNSVIHLPHDIRRTLIVTCQITEERTGDGHIKRCGHPLACHIADDEEHLIAFDDEVIEVTPHLLGRCHGGEKVEVVTIGEHGGQHTHLDIMGDDELTLQTFLAGCGHLQVFNMLFQGGLHIGKGFAQLQQLVLGMDLRQRGVEVAVGNAHCRLGKLLQGFHHLIDGPCTADEQRDQTDDEHDGAVLHNLMCQRQRHAVTRKVEEQDNGH